MGLMMLAFWGGLACLVVTFVRHSAMTHLLPSLPAAKPRWNGPAPRRSSTMAGGGSAVLDHRLRRRGSVV